MVRGQGRAGERDRTFTDQYPSTNIHHLTIKLLFNASNDFLIIPVPFPLQISKHVNLMKYVGPSHYLKHRTATALSLFKTLTFQLEKDKNTGVGQGAVVSTY